MDFGTEKPADGFFLPSNFAYLDRISRFRRASAGWFCTQWRCSVSALALAAKSTACTLPAALLLILWWKQKPLGAKAIFETVPFFVLALGAGLIAIWWEKYHQGTRVLVSLSPLERILIASRAIWFYLGKLLWPSNLTFIYPRWRIVASDPTAYCWLLAIAAAVAVLYFGRRVFGRGVATACLFFVLTLSPLLGFIMLYTFRYTFVADHYQYLACIGPIALVSAAFAKLSRPQRKCAVDRMDWRMRNSRLPRPADISPECHLPRC